MCLPSDQILLNTDMKYTFYYNSEQKQWKDRQ